MEFGSFNRGDDHGYNLVERTGISDTQDGFYDGSTPFDEFTPHATYPSLGPALMIRD